MAASAAARPGTDLADRSSFTVNSWHLGFQADLYQQNGGSIPTVTLQTTVTRAVPNGPLATTNFNNILELDYAFDEDETKGLLAGVQYTRVDIESSMARINSTMLGYVGGWPGQARPRREKVTRARSRQHVAAGELGDWPDAVRRSQYGPDRRGDSEGRHDVGRGFWLLFHEAYPATYRLRIPNNCCTNEK
jgi:hypothetical protein